MSNKSARHSKWVCRHNSTFSSCNLQRGSSYLLGELKTVLRGLRFVPNSLSGISISSSHLVLFFTTFPLLTSLTWCSLNLFVLTLIVYKLYCLYFLQGTNQSFLRSILSLQYHYWFNLLVIYRGSSKACRSTWKKLCTYIICWRELKWSDYAIKRGWHKIRI